jgi:hypothetical protein
MDISLYLWMIHLTVNNKLHGWISSTHDHHYDHVWMKIVILDTTTLIKFNLSPDEMKENNQRLHHIVSSVP